jgi:hypothetical protein
MRQDTEGHEGREEEEQQTPGDEGEEDTVSEP